MARSRRRRPRNRPPGSSSATPTKPHGGPKAPGARVARVAVDDETWAAFRELCGSTPASIRLGKLVRADVKRAGSEAGAEVAASVAAIRQQLDALEARLADQGGE